MFKNREFRIRVAKTSDPNTDNQETGDRYTPAMFIQDIPWREVAITTSICVAGVVLAAGLTQALEETLIHTAKTKIK